MKHCILSKFKEEEKGNILTYLPDIKEIFNQTLDIEGINKVDYHLNCIDRENRYHLLIEIDMEESALPVYDKSAPHKLWKEKYGDKLEKKAIFDFDD